MINFQQGKKFNWSLKKQKANSISYFFIFGLDLFLWVCRPQEVYTLPNFWTYQKALNLDPSPIQKARLTGCTGPSEGTVQNLAQGGSEKYTAKNLAVLYMALMSWNVIYVL
jgi:hypothetical protein